MQQNETEHTANVSGRLSLLADGVIFFFLKGEYLPPEKNIC
jgi:hypothetical protein